MSVTEEAIFQTPPLLAGEPKGRHDAACIESYLSLGIPEHDDRWRQYDLTTEEGRVAHSTFATLLGVEEPTFVSHEPEPLTPHNLEMQSGAFLTRQAFQDSDARVVLYRAYYA